MHISSNVSQCAKLHCTPTGRENVNTHPKIHTGLAFSVEHFSEGTLFRKLHDSKMYKHNDTNFATANNNHNNNNGSMYDDSMSDEVFEEPAVTAMRKAAAKEHAKIRHQHQALAATIAADVADLRTKPSPSGYPGYTPSREALQMYACDNAEEYFQPDRDGVAARTAAAAATVSKGLTLGVEEVTDVEVDGWKSYELEDSFDDSIVHKVIFSSVALQIIYFV